MLDCANCDNPISGASAYLDDELVCVRCFARIMGKNPPAAHIMTEDHVEKEIRKRPIKKPTVRYKVVTTNAGAGRVTAMTAKRNIVAIPNLAPGSYTSAYKVSLTKDPNWLRELTPAPFELHSPPDADCD